MEEKKQAGREYKVGDKILIPHAEELLLKNWEVTSSRSALATLSMESLVEITWCGKEIEIIGIEGTHLRLSQCKTCNPEHLGLPAVKRKVKRSGWVNVNLNETLSYKAFATKEEADEKAHENRIDCVQICWRE